MLPFLQSIYHAHTPTRTYAYIHIHLNTYTQKDPLLTELPHSYRALHQNKVRDHQATHRQHHRQRGQGVPHPSRRAASSQVSRARGRARDQARGHRACQAKEAATAGREPGEQRVVALVHRRAVWPARARAVERFRLGVAGRRRRAAAAAAVGSRRRAVPAPGRRGLGRPLVCRPRRRRRRHPRLCLTAGPGRVPGPLAAAGS